MNKPIILVTCMNLTIFPSCGSTYRLLRDTKNAFTSEWLALMLTITEKWIVWLTYHCLPSRKNPGESLGAKPDKWCIEASSKLPWRAWESSMNTNRITFGSKHWIQPSRSSASGPGATGPCGFPFLPPKALPLNYPWLCCEGCILSSLASREHCSSRESSTVLLILED